LKTNTRVFEWLPTIYIEPAFALN